MSRLSTYGSVICSAGLIGFPAVMPGEGSASAQSLNDVVRCLYRTLPPANDDSR